MPKNHRSLFSSAWFVGLFTLLCGQTSLMAQPAKTPTSRPTSKPLPTSRAVAPSTRSALGAVHHKQPSSPKLEEIIQSSTPFVHAILLNGGGEAESNYYSHVLYLRMMRMILQERGLLSSQIDIFSSDGDDPAPDQAILTQRKDKEGWLFEGRRESRLYARRPKLINTHIAQTTLYPATKKSLKKRLPLIAKSLKSPNKPLLLFVTDHGTRNTRETNARNNKISLWNESLSVRELHKQLRVFGKRRVVSVMSQCFSGSFVWSVFRKPGVFGIPTGDRCGFYATLPSQYAYGCFPETQLKKHVGHAYRFILAMRKAKDLNEAHRQVLLTDLTPDVPHRSSDGYLYGMLKADADADEISIEKLADKLLKRYASLGYPDMEKDQALIGAIARRFSLQSPLSLQALQRQRKALKKKLSWWRRVERMWANVFHTARDHHLGFIYKQNPGFKKRVDKAIRDFLKERKTSHNPPTKKPKRRFAKRRIRATEKLKKSREELLKRYRRLLELRRRIRERRELLKKKLRQKESPKKEEGKEPQGSKRFKLYQEPKHSLDPQRLGDRLRRLGFLRFLKRAQRGDFAIRSRPTYKDTARSLKSRLVRYLEMRPLLLERFRKLRQRETEMHDFVFQLKVQLAALQRIELLLYRIAGRLLLEHSKHPDHQGYRRGLENLLACEHTSLGEEHAPLPKLPPISFDGDKLPLPSWFGISFAPVRSPEKHLLPSGAIRVREVYLNTPAHRAGIVEGDVITTLGKHELNEPFEIRERVMVAPAEVDMPILVVRLGRLIPLNIRFHRLTQPPALKRQSLVGKGAPRLETLRSTDAQKDLPSLKHGTRLVFFWATWCGPCKAALPSLRALQKVYQEKGFRILTVSNEKDVTVKTWLAKNPRRMPFDNAVDPQRELFSALRINATPTFVLFHKGKVRLYLVGFSKKNQSKLQETLEKLLP
ncbi:MAG: redoxin domain-containing protein [Myxococcales bacterium]|nr:redoxin domain-containing protein [Myxococcales bacterium]